MILVALIELLLLMLPLAAAVAVFVYLQNVLNAPDRERFNQEWFERFEAHQREPRTMRCEPLGQRRADAAGRTGDEHPAAAQRR